MKYFVILSLVLHIHTKKKGIENFQKKNKKKLLRHSVNMFKITEKNIKQLKQ